MVLEQYVAAFRLQRGGDRPGEHSEHPGQVEMAMHLVVEDGEIGEDRLAHRGDAELQRVALPMRLDIAAARDLLVKLVDIVADPFLGGVFAQFVRKVDVDRLAHSDGVAGAAALFKRPLGFMLFGMALVAALSLLLASGAQAQPEGPQPAESWNPAAPYVTAGQDEAGYRNWYLAAPWHPAGVKAFNDYLTAWGVGGVAPTWQILRTASDWQICGAQPFEIPPVAAWPNIVAALRYVGSYVVPKIGPVEVVSVYRNPALNACAKGAPESTHKTLGAVDMVPLTPISREALMTELCTIHQQSGERFMIGLGLYKGIRFHIDAKRYREWGMAGARGTFGCTAVLTEGPMPYVPEPSGPQGVAAEPPQP